MTTEALILAKEFIFRTSVFYGMTPPPTVVIVGSTVGDNQQVDIESGVVRGYDAISGKLLWTWEPLPLAEKQKIRAGAGNVWSVISASISPPAALPLTFIAPCAREITAMPIRSLPWMLLQGRRSGLSKSYIMISRTTTFPPSRYSSPGGAILRLSPLLPRWG